MVITLFRILEATLRLAKQKFDSSGAYFINGMVWFFATFLAVALANGAVPGPLPAPHLGSVRLAAFEVQAQPAYDPSAEDELLHQANRARSRSDVPSLQQNDCLTRAARRHASEMAEQQQLSHQFPGEPGLAQRLGENCNIHFDEAAENVALADSADRAHDSLMNSPVHRANLLYPSYNAVGMGVVRRGSTLYVVQDFAHVLPSYSASQAEDAVAKSVQQARASAYLPALPPRGDPDVHAEACALAKADSLRPPKPAQPGEARYILRYTSLQPENLPAAATKSLADRSVNAFAAGVCFARSATYPNGVYWVVLKLY